jgi:DNA topoisomerase-1
MVLRQGRFGQFLACSRYPQCKGTKALGTGVKCPLDGGEVLQKRTRRGRVFFSCSNYPKCKFATWQRPVAKACPRCGSPYMLQSKRQGKLLLSCPRKDCPYQEPLLQDEQA